MKIEVEFKKNLEWLAANKLIINLGKTHRILFNNSICTQPVLITANGKMVKEMSQVKLLGNQL